MPAIDIVRVDLLRKEIERARARLDRQHQGLHSSKKTERSLYGKLIEESTAVFVLLNEGRSLIPSAFAGDPKVQRLDRLIEQWRAFVEDPSGWRVQQQRRQEAGLQTFTSYGYDVGSLDDLCSYARTEMHESQHALREAANAVLYARRGS